MTQSERLHRAPGRAARVVERPRLVGRLDAAVDRQLVLLRAPAGYGKSTLLAQWLAGRMPGSTACISFDPGDGASAVARKFCDALLSEGGDHYSTLSDLIDEDGDRLGDAFISAFCDAVRATKGVLLVLDHIDNLNGSRVAHEIAKVLEQSARWLHVVAVCREEPAISLHRWRLLDELVVIDHHELAFDRLDVQRLARRAADVELAPADVDEILARTEGWPAALGIAANELGDIGVAASIARIDGSRPLYADYFARATRTSSPVVLELLRQSAIVQQVSAPLCNAIGERSDAAQLLDVAERSALFVDRVDDSREWFRLHGMFRSWLRSTTSESTSEQVLHERAAAWFVENDRLRDAVPHFSAAERWSQMIEAVRSHFSDILMRGEAATAAGWLARVPKERLSDSARLMRAALHAVAGSHDMADDVLRQVDDRVPATAIAADAVRVIRFNHEPDPTRIDLFAGRLLDGLATFHGHELPGIPDCETPSAMRKTALLGRGMAAMYAWRPDAARRYLATGRSVPAGIVGSDIFALSGLALLDSWEGNFSAGRRRVHAAQSCAQQAGAGRHPSFVCVQLVLARIARAHNDLMSSRNLLEAADDGLRRDPAPALLGLVVAEQLMLALAEPESTDVAALLNACRSLPLMPPAPTARLLAAQAWASVFCGDRRNAAALLESAPVATPEVVDIRLRLAMTTGDSDGARRVISKNGGPRSREQAIWTAVLHDQEGSHKQASAMLRETVAGAAASNDVRVLVDVGSPVRPLLRAQYAVDPSPFLRRVLDVPLRDLTGGARAAIGARRPAGCVEQLSRREHAVLSLLPTRLSNLQIAEELDVSVNTLKTHLKHVYRKLGVTSRREAVLIAEKEQLL
jgi:LuxR family maltose regulon positive regulatory protein